MATVYANCDPSRVGDLTADIRRALRADKVGCPSHALASTLHQPRRHRVQLALASANAPTGLLLRGAQISRASELVYNEPRKLTAFAHQELATREEQEVCGGVMESA